jgi:hypothetical protein
LGRAVEFLPALFAVQSHVVGADRSLAMERVFLWKYNTAVCLRASFTRNFH